MSIETLKQIKTAFLILIIFTLLTGVVYPFVVTGLAQFFFPLRANGSLIKHGGKIIGSILIGQSFTDPRYFFSRPSATSPYPYNAASSSGSNLGPSNPNFLAQVEARVKNLKKVDPQNNLLIPVDLVTASGSGLDPEISPDAAYYQVLRIAKARQIPVVVIQTLIRDHIKDRSFYLLGEPRVNVLRLNLALDRLKK